MDGRPTWTDCDEAGDYVVPNVLSPRDLVFRPDNMDETVPHTHICAAESFNLILDLSGTKMTNFILIIHHCNAQKARKVLITGTNIAFDTKIEL